MRGSSSASRSRIAGVASDEPSSTTTISYGRSASAAPARVQNSAARPSSLSIGATTLSRRSSRADMTGRSVEPRYDPNARDARPREHPAAAGRLLRGDPEVLPRHAGAAVGMVDRRAHTAGARDPAAGHLQVVEVDD